MNEWGLDCILHFLEAHKSDSGAALAVIMAVNNLLENSTLRKTSQKESKNKIRSWGGER